MHISNVHLIVDQYKLFEAAKHSGRKIDSRRTAKTLSQTVEILGPVSERIAIIEEHDRDGLEAFQKANFQVRSMNGERDQAIHEFIESMRDRLQFNQPKYLVAVTNDPVFHYLFQTAPAYKTEPRVLVPGQVIPPVFRSANYDVRLLSEIIPEPKPTRYDVRIDYENIHIGLEKNGIFVPPKILIEAIKQKAASLGDVGSVVAYADWDLLSKNSRYNIQRELALISGVETRYQPNEKGKNSADMVIADHIRTLVEKSSGAPDAVDIIILCTGDRDFRPVVDTAKNRDKKVIIFTVRGTLSAELREAADEVYYIDDFLKTNIAIKPLAKEIKPNDDHAELAMQFMAFIKRKRWSFVYPNRLKGILGTKGTEQLRQAIAAKVLSERDKKLSPNFQHPLIQAVNHLLQWAPWRIKEGLRKPNFNYIDSNYLAMGMQRDRKLKELGVGQDRNEAEQWLDLVALTGTIVKGTQPHPRDPNQTITVWSLPKTTKKGKRKEKSSKSAKDQSSSNNSETSTTSHTLEVSGDAAKNQNAVGTTSPSFLSHSTTRPQIASQKELQLHCRRLQKLKERKAAAGNSTDPSLDIEIEDLEKKIAEWESQG